MDVDESGEVIGIEVIDASNYKPQRSLMKTTYIAVFEIAKSIKAYFNFVKIQTSAIW